MPKILIAGCGYVGLVTGQLFRDNGWEVEGWTASDVSARELTREDFVVRAVDITDAAAVANAGGGYDAIVQSVSSRGGNAEAYRQIYLSGARHLSSAFPDARLLFTSSTSVYAQREGEWVTELSAAEPVKETAAVLRETEEVVLAAGGVIARLGGIYGPGRSALLRKFLAGTAAISPEEPRYLNQVHRDDVASALFLLVTQLCNARASSPGSANIFNITDNHPLTERQCYESLAARLGGRVPPTAAAGTERKRGNSNKRVSSARLHALGWSPLYPDFTAGMTNSVLPALPEHGA